MISLGGIAIVTRLASLTFVSCSVVGTITHSCHRVARTDVVVITRTRDTISHRSRSYNLPSISLSTKLTIFTLLTKRNIKNIYDSCFINFPKIYIPSAKLHVDVICWLLLYNVVGTLGNTNPCLMCRNLVEINFFHTKAKIELNNL